MVEKLEALGDLRTGLPFACSGIWVGYFSLNWL